MVSLLSAETLPVAVATQSKAATAVYIGVPACEQETATAWAASPYISKIGGPPASFDGTTINSGKCRYCDAPLCLVAQIYAPLDFPRSVLIFGCNQTKCTHHKSPGAWRVVRLQDSRDTNPWGVNTPQMGQRCNNSALAACSIPTSVTSTEEEDEDWDALLATRDAVIASRAASTPTTNGGFGKMPEKCHLCDSTRRFPPMPNWHRYSWTLWTNLDQMLMLRHVTYSKSTSIWWLTQFMDTPLGRKGTTRNNLSFRAGGVYLRVLLIQPR